VDRSARREFLDSGAPWYGCYQTKDGKYISIGTVEPKFYSALLARIGVDEKSLPGQYDRAQWPAMRERFKAVFATKTRDEWCALLEDQDVCFARCSISPRRSSMRMRWRAAAIPRSGASGNRRRRRDFRGRRARSGRAAGARGAGAGSPGRLGFGAEEIERLVALGLGLH
jgi:alpha-methylacyl-CoA racemase